MTRLVSSSTREERDTIANTNYKLGYDEGYLDGYSVAIEDLKWLGDEAVMIEEVIQPETSDPDLAIYLRERERRWLLVLIKAVKYATGQVIKEKENE